MLPGNSANNGPPSVSNVVLGWGKCLCVCVLGQGEQRPAQSPHRNPDQEQNLDPEACWCSLHSCQMFCGSWVFLADVAVPVDISKLALAADVCRSVSQCRHVSMDTSQLSSLRLFPQIHCSPGTTSQRGTTRNNRGHRLSPSGGEQAQVQPFNQVPATQTVAPPTSGGLSHPG